MTNIDRRALLTRGVTALASVGEDAEFLRLWEEWKTQFARCGEVNAVLNDVEGRVFDETPLHWRLDAIYESHAMPHAVPPGSLHAHFVAYRAGKPSHRFEPIKAADVMAAFRVAKSAEAMADAERDTIEKTAKRKYRWAAADRADKQANKQLSEIEDKIADTPADGLSGILVKLAVWRFWNDLDDGSEHYAVLCAYETRVEMTGGVDLAAEVERW
jgi:hypothetical protein